MTADVSFDTVLEAARSGAEWAVSSLYRSLQPALLRYLRAQEPRDAEDIASEVWLGVARALTRFEGGEHDFRRWVFAIARRRLIDHRRALKRRATDVAFDHDMQEAWFDADGADPVAFDGVTAGDALRRIAALPADQADVVLLRVVGGFSSEEVGELVGKRPGTVRVLQHRALLRLAAELRAQARDEALVTMAMP